MQQFCAEAKRTGGFMGAVQCMLAHRSELSADCLAHIQYSRAFNCAGDALRLCPHTRTRHQLKRCMQLNRVCAAAASLFSAAEGPFAALDGVDVSLGLCCIMWCGVVWFGLQASVSLQCGQALDAHSSHRLSHSDAEVPAVGDQPEPDRFTTPTYSEPPAGAATTSRPAPSLVDIELQSTPISSAAATDAPAKPVAASHFWARRAMPQWAVALLAVAGVLTVVALVFAVVALCRRRQVSVWCLVCFCSCSLRLLSFVVARAGGSRCGKGASAVAAGALPAAGANRLPRASRAARYVRLGHCGVSLCCVSFAKPTDGAPRSSPHPPIRSTPCMLLILFLFLHRRILSCR
jgi:hypothetical protein